MWVAPGGRPGPDLGAARGVGCGVGLGPLRGMVAVVAVGCLFVGVAVLLACPIAAVLATVVDVAVRGKDPTDEEIPRVLFPAQERETL